MDMQNMTNSQTSISRLSSAIDELIAVISKQKIEYQHALTAKQEKIAAADNKIAILQAQIQAVKTEKEQLTEQLQQIQNNSETETKLQNLQNEVETRNIKINGLQTEIQNLHNALNNRKAQIEELTAKIAELQEKLSASEQKAADLETNSQNNSQINAEIQAKLDEQTLQRDLWEQKYQDSEAKILQMQQTISETTDNIDDVVSRLERVLEENGTSDNNN